jgi:hypothetical protein
MWAIYFLTVWFLQNGNRLSGYRDSYNWDSQSSKEKTSPDLLRGDETILLFEDESRIRALLGYKVVEADDAISAMEIIDTASSDSVAVARGWRGHVPTDNYSNALYP